MTKAKDDQRLIFKTQVVSWSKKLRVNPTQIRIQKMSRKWGSCSPTGRVNFSTELLSQSRRFQDYVIVHELLHLKVRNHGKLFKALLRTHLGNAQFELKRI